MKHLLKCFNLRKTLAAPKTATICTAVTAIAAEFNTPTFDFGVGVTIMKNADV